MSVNSFSGQDPLTDKDRERWPHGQPLSSGIYGGSQELTPAIMAQQESLARKCGSFSRPATMNAVLVEIIDGKRVVSVMVRNEECRPELEAAAHDIIRSGLAEYGE